MTLTTAHLSISLDGYVAGPDQSFADPLGRGGLALHRWHLGSDQGEVDARWSDRILRPGCAYVMGRNMFGPVRRDWPDDTWKGWWGDNPPYHAPTFVLTHYPRDPIEMEGGTVFHFVTDGIAAALEQAKKVAGGKNVKIGGGVSTVRQYLQAGLVDEMHLAISPVALGNGEALFAGIDLPALGFSVTEHAATDTAIHIMLAN